MSAVGAQIDPSETPNQQTVPWSQAYADALPARAQPGWYLIRVRSGDTLVIAHESNDIQISVRLKGVVAPTRTEQGGLATRSELKRCLDGVNLSVAFFDKDQFGQPYVTIRTNEISDVAQYLLGLEMVRPVSDRIL